METTEEVMETKPIQESITESSPVKSQDKIDIDEEEKQDEAEKQEKEEEAAKRKSFLDKLPGILKRKSQQEAQDMEKGQAEEEDKEKKETRRSKIFPEIKLPAIMKPKEPKTEIPAEPEGGTAEPTTQGPIQRPKFWHNLNLPPMPDFLKRNSTAEVSSPEEGERSESPNKDLNDDNKEAEAKMEEVKLELVQEKPSNDTENKEDFRETLLTQVKSLPKSCFIGGGIVLLILLIIIIIISVVSKPGRHYDSSDRFVDGGFVRTPTSCGWVQGLIDEPGFSFLGIPYSLPPVGDRRWLPSETPSSLSECWTGTLKVYNRSLPCWYYNDDGHYDGSEDCLTLDIYTPKVSYDNPLPVVVFIGGENLNGGLTETLRPSAELAVLKNVVFVHVQYRLGVLGFLALSNFMNKENPPRTGNYGLSDLHTALKWINLNIEHFGGDPNSLVLLGHGAGATLGAAALSSRTFKDQFDKAWLTGGAGYFRNWTLREVNNETKEYTNSIGCSDVKCLMESSAEDLIEAVPESWKHVPKSLPKKGERQHSWLVIDGEYLMGHPEDEWSTRKKTSVPTVIGMNRHEDMDVSLYGSFNWEDREAVEQKIKDELGTFSDELANEALQMYKIQDNGWAMYTQMVSDVRTVCPLLKMARDIAANFDSKVYAYVATHSRNNSEGSTTDNLSDIQAILSLYEEHTMEDTQFVQNMQEVFYNFVYDGIMTDNQRVPRNIYLIDDDVETESRYPNCDYWSSSELYPQYARVD